MNINRPSIRSLLTLIIATIWMFSTTGSPVYAQEKAPTDEREEQMEHKFEKAKQYYGECKHTDEAQFEAIRPYLKAFTDAEVMAETMADPVKFAKLMQVVSDPRTMHVMTKCATEPVMWDTWMRGLTDFNKLGRAMTRFMNPMMYFNWMMAPMNPQVYSSLFSMMDPSNLNRWIIASMNPVFYQPFFAPLDPSWYTPRLQWMMDPRSFQPMMNMLTIPVMPGMPAPQPMPQAPTGENK